MIVRGWPMVKAFNEEQICLQQPVNQGKSVKTPIYD